MPLDASLGNDCARDGYADGSPKVGGNGRFEKLEAKAGKPVRST
jgi:hypothetical protein